MQAKGPRPVIIKKYENRRLYNTLTSQYINQEQVAQLVRDGQDVRVIDAATGEDITRLILAQIVLEDAKTPNSVFPLDVLRQMIVASGKATQEGALRYFKAMMDIYQSAYRAMPSPLNPFEFLPPVWPQGTAQEPPGSGQAASYTGESPASTPAADLSAEAELRRRVDELEAALSSRKRAPRNRKSGNRKSTDRQPKSRRNS